MRYTILLVDNRQPVVSAFSEIVWGEDYALEICSSAPEAVSYIKEQPVHLVFLANQLADLDGIQLMHLIQQLPATSRLPLVMISDEQDYRKRIAQMLEGIDDYFMFPFEPLELLSRIQILLQEVYNPSVLQRRSAKGFSGNLVEMNLLDLLQTLELARKTGTIHLQRNLLEAQVFVQDGLVYDAKWVSLSGEDALFRLFTWTEGHFFVEFRPIERERKINISSQDLIFRGLKILEEWELIRAEFPTLSMVPQLTRALAAKDLKSDWQPIVPLIDGTKSLRYILEASALSEIQTLTVIRQMQHMGLIREAFPDLETELLLKSETEPSPKFDVDVNHLNRVLNHFYLEIIGKKQPNERIKRIYPQFESTLQGQEAERIQAAVPLDRIELQYLKRKLL